MNFRTSTKGTAPAHWHHRTLSSPLEVGYLIRLDPDIEWTILDSMLAIMEHNTSVAAVRSEVVMRSMVTRTIILLVSVLCTRALRIDKDMRLVTEPLSLYNIPYDLGTLVAGTQLASVRDLTNYPLFSFTTPYLERGLMFKVDKS